MEITLKRHRYYTIYNWKRIGLIYSDYDELYNRYINTLECQHCHAEFKSTRDRHLDHCHITGQFRKIVCRKCNCNDSYIKYPDGFTEEDKKKNHKEYYENNREELNKYNKEYLKNNREILNEKQRQKHTCECGGKYTRVNKVTHMKSKRHQKFVENN